jgi:hypothetical protein
MEQAELGIEDARRTPHLAHSFLRRTGLDLMTRQPNSPRTG